MWYIVEVRFTVLKFFVLTVLTFLCLSCSTQATQSQQRPSPSSLPQSALEATAFTDSFEADNIVKSIKPIPSTVSMSFGPQLLELKASYFERREQAPDLSGLWREEKVQRFLDLLGSSSLGGSGFIGEGELAYSPLDSSPVQSAGSEWPKMLRLGVKNRWGNVNFGADYRSMDQGFVSITGARTEQARDEAQLWGERSLGPFNLRGTVGQSWEQLADNHDVRITKTATASFNLTRPQWSGMFTSSYALVEPGISLDSQMAVVTNSLTGSYRPLSFFSLGPSFTLRQEFNRNTGVRTESPMTALSFAYTPVRDAYKVTGGTSFSRSLSADGSKDLRTVGTTANFDWKIGAFLGRQDVLSFNLNYNHQLDPISSPRSRADFLGMLQLKVTGF
jgi:hypothetical protein